MARPNRDGFDYFNFDTDFLKDIKVRKIMRATNAGSISVLLDLLCYIYSDHGYYMVWDADTAFIVADDTENEEDFVNDVVAKAVEVGFFSQQMFNQFSILTSHGIQKRVKRMARKRSDFNIRKPYLLLDLPEETRVSGAETPVKGTKTPVSGVQGTQREIEREIESESKEKKSEPKYGPDDCPFQLAEKLLGKIKERLPNVKEPNLQTWANDIRLAHERDNRPYEKLSKMIDWSQADDFWQANILSAAKLRKKYDTMAAQANRKTKGNGRVKETLPGWAKDDYAPPVKQVAKLSPEQRAKMNAQLARLNNRDKQRETENAKT